MHLRQPQHSRVRMSLSRHGRHATRLLLRQRRSALL